MTNNEAKRKVRGYLTDMLPSDCSDEINEIMKALEQQPCEDCISREAVLQYFMPNEAIHKVIEALPSVIPQRPKGKWIGCKCSKCNYEVMEWNKNNYCPNCGAEMGGVE